MYTKEDIEKAKQYLSDEGYGTGSNFTLDTVANLMAEWSAKNTPTASVGDPLTYSEREVDFAYLTGVFNVSGIDGLQKEIERLKGIGKNPHDIFFYTKTSRA